VVTVAVAGTLLGLAVPSFTALMLNSRRTVTINNFVHSTFLARSSALEQGRTVSICRSTDGETCSTSTSDWQHGWMVFVNTDRDEPAVRDEGENVLSVVGAQAMATITSNRPSYSFKPYYHGVVNGTLVFCDRRGPAEARALIINHAGRPRVSPLDSNGRRLRCPSGGAM
jgi:type IV fimbrial biogenesis protein FimT